MKSNLNRNMKMRKDVLGLRKHMANGGDIISRGNQRMDDAIEAMSNGQPAPSMQQSMQQHPAPAPQTAFPTDATPALDKIIEAGISLGLRSGGPVRGPGGPTDDKVPAMLSHGEYVLPADTVQAVGKKNLDTLRDRTHAFVGPRPGMADGGEPDPFAHQQRPYGFGGDITVQPVHVPGTQYKPHGFGAVTPYQGSIRSQFDQALGVSPQGLDAQAHSAIANAAPAAEIDTAGIEDPVARAAQAQPIFYQGLRNAIGSTQPLIPPPNNGQLSALGVQPMIPPPNNGVLPGMADGGMPRKPSMFGGQPFANGGLALYDEARMKDTNAWTGSPSLRFLANGGMPVRHMQVGGYVDPNQAEMNFGQNASAAPGQVGQAEMNFGPNASAAPAPTQSSFQQTLDDTIGQRAQAAKAARMGPAPQAPAPGPVEGASNYGNRAVPESATATPSYRTNAPEGSPQFRQTPAPGVAEEAEKIGGRFGKIISGLRGKVLTVGGVAEGAAGWLGRARPLLDAAYAAYGGYQGATEGEQAQAADLGQSQVPTLNSAKGMNAVDATIAHGGSNLLMGALSPQDILWGTGDRSMSVPRDQQGWGARTLNDLTGANERPDFNNVVGTNGASPNSLRKIGTPNAAAPAAAPANLPPGSYPGGTQDPRNVVPGQTFSSNATDFAGKPLGYGTQTTTRIPGPGGNYSGVMSDADMAAARNAPSMVNQTLRTFSDGTGNVPATMGPQDFANLAKGGSLTPMSADAFTHPGSGLGPNTPELGSTGVGSQGQSGGVFHMPRRDPMDSINDHFDALEKQIGPIGNSADRLHSLQALEGERGSLGANIYGTQTQGDISRNEAAMRAQEFARGLSNDRFEHNFQGSELGLRNLQYQRELGAMQHGYQIQAEHYANDRDEVARQHILDSYKGMDGFGLDDKGNLNANATQRAQGNFNRIQAAAKELGYGGHISNLDPASMVNVARMSDEAGQDERKMSGFKGALRAAILGSPRNTDPNSVLGYQPAPNSRNNGATYDTFQNGLGDVNTVNEFTRGGILPMGPTNLLKAQQLDMTGNGQPQNRADGGMIRRGGLRARKNG